MARSAVLFELTAEQVLPVLRRATADPTLRDFETAGVRHLPPEQVGYCAQVRIAPFCGRTGAGREWEPTLLAKRMHWTGDREALHFERLGRMGLPVVHCHGCVPGACTASGCCLVLGRTLPSPPDATVPSCRVT